MESLKNELALENHVKELVGSYIVSYTGTTSLSRQCSHAILCPQWLANECKSWGRRIYALPHLSGNMSRRVSASTSDRSREGVPAPTKPELVGTTRIQFYVHR